MARRKDHTRDQLRSLILESAEKQISSDGIRSLTTRRIATAIGYAPGTIYNIFKDADDLISHVNARTLRRFNEKLELVELSSDRVSNARALLAVYMSFQRSNERLWEANVSHAIRQDISQPEVYETELARAFDLVAHAIVPNESSIGSQKSQIAVRTLWAALNGIAQIPPSSKMLQSLNINVADLADTLVVNYMSGWEHAEKKSI